ncbi:MAG: GGDEF domain-containing protein [Ectothiorhodospiraceae bacterium]
MAWRIALGVGLTLAALYAILPYGSIASAAYVLSTLGASIVMLSAIPHRPDTITRLACGLIALGVGLAAVGHAIWYALDLLGGSPFPSYADAFYLAVYPLFIAALWLLGRRTERNEGAFTDAVIVGITAAVLGWAFMVSPYLQDPSLDTLALLVSTAYPVADLVVLPFALRLVFLGRTRETAHLLILMGVLAYLGADMLYAHGNTTGWYQPGGLTDALWLVAYALLAAAAWCPPSAMPLTQGGAARAVISERRVVLLGATAMVLPVVILTHADSDPATVSVAAGGMVLLLVLVMIRMAHLVRTSGRQRELLEILAQTDPLTGAANRRYLEQVLERELPRVARARGKLSVAFLDLDHFKQFNDSRGHEAGDHLLRDMVAAWQRELRPADVLARLGGEEFLVVLPDTGPDEAHAAIQRLRELVPEQQTCSAGIAGFRAGESAGQLTERADRALYEAKRSGRDRIIIDQPAKTA